MRLDHIAHISLLAFKSALCIIKQRQEQMNLGMKSVMVAVCNLTYV